jgi:uncharacterized protein (TIGR02246 family)
MAHPRRRIPSLLAALAAACACAHARGPAGPAEEAAVRAAITAANEEFAQALVRGDARAMAALFTEDSELIPASRPGFVSGRPEIEAFHAQRLRARRYLDVVITTVKVGVSGDLAWETGTSRATVQQGDGAPVTFSGRHLAVWKRGADGRWRIRADLPIADPVP